MLCDDDATLVATLERRLGQIAGMIAGATRLLEELLAEEAEIVAGLDEWLLISAGRAADNDPDASKHYRTVAPPDSRSPRYDARP